MPDPLSWTSFALSWLPYTPLKEWIAYFVPILFPSQRRIADLDSIIMHIYQECRLSPPLVDVVCREILHAAGEYVKEIDLIAQSMSIAMDRT